jgi:thiol:disulfide interchange protein
MNKTLSPQQIRLVFGLGVLAIAVAAWALYTVRQTSDSTSSPVAVPTHTKPVHHAKPAHHAKATTTHVTKTTHGTKTHVTKRHAATPVKIARHGLPLKVAMALTKHRVVVVSLSMGGVALDELAHRESEAGAEAANAGFVSLNVVKQREGGPLLTKLGVVDTPAVLVVRRRGGSVFAKLHGFVDRQTVEQAVADARR